MPNFGLMSGNPYYYGPSGLAAGVGAFADNLLKAYGTFSGVNQKQQEIEMQKKLMQIKLDEEANKVKQREAMEAYEKGLAKPVQGLMAQTQTFTPPDEIPSEWTWTPEARQVQPETVTAQVPTTYANQMEAWKAEGKNPEIEYLRGAYSTIAKYDPEKALALREKLYSATTSAELREALIDIKKAQMEMTGKYQDAIIGVRKEGIEKDLKRLEETNRHNQVLEILRKTGGSGAGDKTTEFDRDYQDYSEWFDASKKSGAYKDPNARKLTRGEYRMYQERQKAAAKGAGTLEGFGGGGTTAAPNTLKYDPRTGELR